MYFPLNLMRPVFDIKTGALSNREKISYVSDVILSGVICDEKFTDMLRDENPEMKINSKISESGVIIISNHSFNKETINFISNNPGKAGTKDGRVIGIFAEKVIGSISELEEIIRGCEEVEYPGEVDFFSGSWDAINLLKNILVQDLDVLIQSSGLNSSNNSEQHINADNIFISESASISAGSVIDATSGKVFIDENAVIEPFCFIKGPAYIGKKSTLKSGTKIYGPVSIGYFSKVAGEISACIYHSFVNKQHDGFTGDSYFCPFVNLGADTVTSNLKNNYSNVRVKINDNEFDSEMQFLGSLVGDHSKTSINTMLNTGSIIGAFANIFGGGFHPKFIKSFSWNDSGKPAVKYDFSKAMVTSEMVMNRRGEKLSGYYKSLCKKIYDETEFD